MSGRPNNIEKGYFGESGRQVHFRRSGSKKIGAEKAKWNETPLLCLPPAPHSGAFFESFIGDIAEKRTVIVPDCPGYGGSDRIEKPDISISDYANRLAICFDGLSKVDLFGFHSGTLIAIEMARIFPNIVGDITLVDIPCFNKSVRDTQTSKLKTGLPSDIGGSYDRAVTQRRAGINEDRAFELWVETLRSGRFQSDLFRAAFAYDCEKEFPDFDRLVTVIATQSGLLEATRQAAELLPKANLIERLDILPPTFEIHANDIADLI
ncbi:alpha/beta hydrolase [Litorimonas haliclonae]|uniref:alpha/beta hydrolase n=1 Tax=Litorimonas haliclonae TaxID=2081977 RepID=UPI0039EF0424